MNRLRVAVGRYLALRRDLGFTLSVQSGLLRRFAEFAAGERAAYVTVALVLRWASEMEGVLPATVSRAVGVVRRFAEWHALYEPRTEVLPKRLLPARSRRRQPFIHSDMQLARLLHATLGLESRNGVRGRTYGTMFALIATTGLRIAEAVRLDRSDFDLGDRTLRIRKTKFGKTRLVPLHSSTSDALAAYLKFIDERVSRQSPSGALFVSEMGRRLTDCAARYNFAVASRKAGQRPPIPANTRVGRYRHGLGPRIHDLRHRFAVMTMLTWYRAGEDAEQQLPTLSTYLGHTALNHTYWYIEAVPELLQLAAARTARRTMGSRP